MLELNRKEVPDIVKWLKEDGSLGLMTEMDEDLFCLLVDKCEGEALANVRSVNPGAGWQAYQRLFRWYGSSSGLAIQES